MIAAFHSVVIDVRAFDVGVRDYGRLLGRSPVRLETNAATGTRSAFFALANMVLEIRAATEAESGTRPSRSPEAAAFGLNGIRLESGSDDPTESLENRGVTLASTQDQEGVSEASLSPRTWRSNRVDPSVSRGIPVEIVSGERPPVGAVVERAQEGEEVVDPAAQVRSLDHVVVLSPDPEATRAFYGDALGLRLALDKSFEERGVRLLFFRVGGTTIEVGGRLGAEPRPDQSDRFGGLAWQVVDLDAIHARLVAEAFDVSEIRTGNKPGTRVCTVRDPVHGVPTLLIEPVS